MTVRGHGRRGEEGAPNPHDNDSHEPDMAEASELDNKADDPHGNEAHDPDFATSGEVGSKADDPHGNEAHDPDFATSGEVDSKADDPHGNEAHTENYLTESDLDNGDDNGVESGIIAMYSGDIANIPNGWELCDGTNGTPDLRDVFIRGAGGNDNPMDTGGKDEVALSENELPSHDHGVDDSHQHSAGSLSTDNSGLHDHDYDVRDSSHTVSFGEDVDVASSLTNTIQTSSDGVHNHGVVNNTGFTSGHVNIESTGGDQAHENKPAYVALAYIMKV